MKIQTYNTIKTQIEIIPRLTIIYSKGIAFEWLFFGIYIGKEVDEKLKIDNDTISYFAESHASFHSNKEKESKKWMELRRSFRSGMLQSLKVLNGDKYTTIL